MQKHKNQIEIDYFYLYLYKIINFNLLPIKKILREFNVWQRLEGDEFPREEFLQAISDNLV